MLKELLILFFIALVAGSIWNGMNDEGAPAAGSGAAQGGTAVPPLEEVADIGSDTFQGLVLDSKDPVLVEFYTTGCVACKKMAPILSQLASENESHFRVYRCNCDKNPGIADRYYSGPVPAFVLFDKGRVLNQTIGSQTKDELFTWIQNNISPFSEPVVTPQQGSLPRG